MQANKYIAEVLSIGSNSQNCTQKHEHDTVLLQKATVARLVQQSTAFLKPNNVQEVANEEHTDTHISF